MDNTVMRTVSAPTEAEARAAAGPVLDAFRAAGWELLEALWVPGDRRPDLGESLVLSSADQLLLDADGALQLSFSNPDPLAVAPSVVAAPRELDTSEAIGGVRYRRLVPRFAIGIVVAIAGLILFFAIASSMSIGPFAATPTPVDGICPLGWLPGMQIDSSGGLAPDGTCQQLNQ